MSPTKVLLVGPLTLAALVATAGPARAQDCKTAADCGKGFTCTFVPSPSAPPTKPCAADMPCAAIEPPPADAGTTTSGYCTEATCATNADCGASMLCHPESYEVCSGGTVGACPANTKCDLTPPEPSSCSTVTTSTCKYKWQLPCNADSECGAGFTC